MHAYACCFCSGNRLHPSWQAGHSRFTFNEAELSSLALRLAPSQLRGFVHKITLMHARLLHSQTDNYYGKLLSAYKIGQT